MHISSAGIRTIGRDEGKGTNVSGAPHPGCVLLNGDQDEEGEAIEAIEDALLAFGATL